MSYYNDPIDSTVIERDGIRYRIDLLPDDLNESGPDDDCYSPSNREAFRRGDWSYVGVIVTPEFSGIDGYSVHDELWGVEYGNMPAETESFRGGKHKGWHVGMDKIVSVHPVPDMISEVRANMRKLRDTLNALSLED